MKKLSAIGFLVGMAIVLVSCHSNDFRFNEYKQSHIEMYQEQQGDLSSQQMLLAGEITRLDSSLKNHSTQIVINLHINNITILINDIFKENMFYFSHMINTNRSRDLKVSMLGHLSTLAYDNQVYGSKMEEAVAQSNYDLARQVLAELKTRFMTQMKLMEIGVEKYLGLCGVESIKNDPNS